MHGHSPEAPLAALHDPQSQEQVGGSVGKNARSQAAAAIGHNVIQHAADEGREPVRAGMTKSKRHRHDSKRETAKFAERYLLEVFVDHKTQQKARQKISSITGTTTTRRRKRKVTDNQ